MHINLTPKSIQVGTKRSYDSVDDILEAMTQKKTKPLAVQLVNAKTAQSSKLATSQTVANTQLSDTGKYQVSEAQ